MPNAISSGSVDWVWHCRGNPVSPRSRRPARLAALKPPPDPHYRHRFPAEIINYAVWGCTAFVSAWTSRMLSCFLVQRGVVASYETVRRWCKKFGASFADCLRRRRPRPGDKWHMDGASRTQLWRGGVELYKRDGGPLDAGSQVQASNHCKLLLLRAVVVSVAADGLPSRIVLRDLDASILDAQRTRPVLRDLGLDLAKDTWRAMPAFEVGGKRLVQAMLFGHLGEVMLCLARITDTKSDNLVSIVEDMWSDLTARAPSTSARRWVQKLRGLVRRR